MSSAVGIFLLSIGFIFHLLRVKLYTKWKFHPFDRGECLEEDMNYDVLLFCCSDDNLAHGNGIRVQLEKREDRVCYPPRSHSGEAVYDNIYNAVVRSKRTQTHSLFSNRQVPSKICVASFICLLSVH